METESNNLSEYNKNKKADQFLKEELEERLIRQPLAFLSNLPEQQQFTPPQITNNISWPSLGILGPTISDVMEYLKIQSCILTDIYDKVKAIEKKLNAL